MYLPTICSTGERVRMIREWGHVSSGTGYGYEYVDLAAQERRRLRTEIAELGARAAIAHARADSQGAAALRQLRLDKVSWRAASTDNAVLAAQASELRQAVTAAEQALDRLAADTWAARPSRKRRHVTTATAAEEFVSGSAGSTGAPTGYVRAPGALAPEAYAAPGAEALGRAVATAEALLAAEAHRCAPDDLDELDRRVTELRAAGRADAARRSLADLEFAVRESIARRKRDERAAIAGARLLARAEEALPEDRDNLVAAITAAPDLDGISGLVDAAIARADRIRQRAAVASAAAAALVDIGADVGEDFVTMLTARGETAVRLGPGWADGYGLLVSLPADKTELSTVVVRHPDAAADPDGGRQAAQDRAAQQQFCDAGLERFKDRIGRDGVRLDQIFKAEPGQWSVLQVPEAKWSRPGETACGHAKRQSSRVTPPAGRERSRER